MDKTIRKGDVVQFIEGHKWIGCTRSDVVTDSEQCPCDIDMRRATE